MTKVTTETDNLYDKVYSYDNLELAFKKARKGKTLKPYVIEFEKQLKQNLLNLRQELLLHTYTPKPLQTFILRDPKTRKISKSDFRDRVVHHAVCNVIEPIFDKTFIYDSYANRINKGTHKAIQRFDTFKHKVSRNNTRNCFVLKADIKHYFETVNHNILLEIISRKIDDENVLWLITCILSNHSTIQKGVGMPLGNLTSQFFANVYLNELDQFVKHKLRAKHYIRYVDDFVILHTSSNTLKEYKQKINSFLQHKLKLELHPDKSKILQLRNGINFLGVRIFPHHKLIRKKNINKFQRKLEQLKSAYKQDKIDREKVVEKFEGWLTYISQANTYKCRKNLTKKFNENFPLKPVNKIQNIKKYEKFLNKTKNIKINFSPQKTQQLFNKGLTIQQIAQQRNIKEGTVWEHLAQLIEYNQCSIWKILPKQKILKILPYINSPTNTLKDIKKRIHDDTITFNEINCVLAHIKCQNKKKNICNLTKWYQKTNCYRKCFFDKKQRETCENKFNRLIAQNPTLEMTRKEFIHLFNNHLTICILPHKEKAQFVSLHKFKLNMHYCRLHLLLLFLTLFFLAAFFVFISASSSTAGPPSKGIIGSNISPQSLQMTCSLSSL